MQLNSNTSLTFQKLSVWSGYREIKDTCTNMDLFLDWFQMVVWWKPSWSWPENLTASKCWYLCLNLSVLVMLHVHGSLTSLYTILPFFVFSFTSHNVCYLWKIFLLFLNDGKQDLFLGKLAAQGNDADAE